MKGMKLGPSIGKMKSARKKNHSNYRKGASYKVATVSLKMPWSSAFRSLQGTAVYKKNVHEIVVTVTATAQETNRGPGIFFRQVQEWHRHQNEDGSARELVEKILSETAKKIQGKELPEVGNFLDRCQRGKDTMTFLEKVCSGCVCWYCELSDA